VRSYRFVPDRFGWMIALALVLSALLVACAGGDSSSESESSDSGGGNQQAPAGETNLVNAAENTPVATDQPSEPLAALVNGQPITMQDFERERMRRSLGMDVQPATADAFDASILQTMIEQVLVEQAAGREGIVVTDAEVDAELEIQAEIADQSGISLDEFVSAQLYTMDEYREAVRGMLLLQKVSQVIVADVPTMTAQVHARHILVTDEATARMLLDQLNQGADFAQLAIQYSLDGSTASSGGDLDWVSEGDLLQPEVEAAIFALAPGTRAPNPVKSSLGYHIVETLERVEDRPLDQAKLAERKEQTFLTWLDNERAAADIEVYIGAGNQ
jgi:peptidyl-prolyl cis-trans isomerase C